MKVKAAVLEEIGRPGPYAQTRPLTIEEIDLEGPREGEVLIKVEAAGLCHSDLSVINGDRPRPVPMVLGHESAGIIQEVGSGVDRFAPGDDYLSGRVGTDVLRGGEGNDCLVDGGGTTFDGGAGRDTADLLQLTGKVNVDFTAGTGGYGP